MIIVLNVYLDMNNNILVNWLKTERMRMRVTAENLMWRGMSQEENG